MPRAKSRSPKPEEANTLSIYNGITGQACFKAGGKMFGPVTISIPDYHTVARAMEEAKRDGAELATLQIKMNIDAVIPRCFKL